MKRSVSQRDQFENLTMANCLMFLARGTGGSDGFDYSSSVSGSGSGSPSRVFECKTCNRQFPSFQALGGHRASHKKPRVGPESSGSESGGSPAKPKTHECTVCGLEFAIGQALGGHMRRHRAAMADLHHHHHHHPNPNPSQALVQPLRRPLLMSNVSSNSLGIASNGGSARRVLCLDLNLTPLENDIKILQLGNPLVNIF